MAFAKIEDETGVINLVILPKIFKDNQKLWVENSILLLTGRLDERNDEVNLIVESLDTKESVSKKKATFFVKIPEKTDVTKLKKLKEILLQNVGESPVTLKFTGSNKEIVLPFGVSWSEGLTRQINKLLEE